MVSHPLKDVWVGGDKIGLCQGAALEVPAWIKETRPEDFERYWELLYPARAELYEISELLRPALEGLGFETPPVPPEFESPTGPYEPIKQLEAARRLLASGEALIVGCEALSGKARARITQHCAAAREALDAALASLRDDQLARL